MNRNIKIIFVIVIILLIISLGIYYYNRKDKEERFKLDNLELQSAEYIEIQLRNKRCNISDEKIINDIMNKIEDITVRNVRFDDYGYVSTEQYAITFFNNIEKEKVLGVIIINGNHIDIDGKEYKVVSGSGFLDKISEVYEEYQMNQSGDETQR